MGSNISSETTTEENARQTLIVEGKLNGSETLGWVMSRDLARGAVRCHVLLWLLRFGSETCLLTR